MLKNSSGPKSNNVRAVAALSNLWLLDKLIKLISVALGTMKFFASKFDLPNQLPRILHCCNGAVKFVWVDSKILHP